MVFAFVQRFGQHIAEASFDGLVHSSHFIVNKLHVSTDRRRAAGAVGEVQPKASLSKDGRPEEQFPPVYEELFESPCFISAHYKDDRAVVKLDNIASHTKIRAHAKNCECKCCRDRGRAFHKGGTGRRYGYRGTPISTRTAPTDLVALRQLSSKPDLQSQQSIANYPLSRFPQKTPSRRSRLRGGNLQILEPGSNRFAVLHVERTKDEEESQQSADKHHDNDSNDDSSSNSAQRPDETLDHHPKPEAFSLTDTLWHQLAAFDNWSDTNVDDSDFAGGDSDDNDNASIATPAALSSTINLSVSNSESKQPHLCTLWRHRKKAFLPLTALVPGSQTASATAEEMPWEEDDREERETLGPRVLSWTRTRLLLRYTQGEEEVEYFVDREVL